MLLFVAAYFTHLAGWLLALLAALQYGFHWLRPAPIVRFALLLTLFAGWITMAMLWFGVVIIPQLDRLSRDVRIAENLFWKFNQLGIRVLIADMPTYDHTNRRDVLIRQIREAIAEAGSLGGETSECACGLCARVNSDDAVVGAIGNIDIVGRVQDYVVGFAQRVGGHGGHSHLRSQSEG